MDNPCWRATHLCLPAVENNGGRVPNVCGSLDSSLSTADRPRRRVVRRDYQAQNINAGYKLWIKHQPLTGWQPYLPVVIIYSGVYSYKQILRKIFISFQVKISSLSPCQKLNQNRLLSEWTLQSLSPLLSGLQRYCTEGQHRRPALRSQQGKQTASFTCYNT